MMYSVGELLLYLSSVKRLVHENTDVDEDLRSCSETKESASQKIKAAGE